MLHVTDLTPLIDVNVALEGTFDFLSEEYELLFARSDATVFQAPIWMDKIHRMLVPHLDAQQYTITVRNNTDNALLAVLPFVKQKAMGITIVQPADFGVCDYNALVAPHETLELLAHRSAVLEQLNALVRAGSLFMFRKARKDGFDIARLFPSVTASACENQAFHCDIDDNFETWRRETLRRKMTKDLERKVRQLHTMHDASEVQVAQTPDDIVETLEFIRKIRGGRFKADLLQNEAYFDFYCAYVIAAAESGEAMLTVKYVGDKPIGALLCLMGGGGFNGVLIAADVENFGKFSLGVQVVYETIKAQFALGVRRFDFGLGDAGYKSHFRAIPSQLHNFTAASNMSGAAVAAVYNYAKPLKNMVRKLVPNLH